MAAHLLLDAWNNDPQLLDQCLILLETALVNSPANYHLKLLITRVYMLAGNMVYPFSFCYLSSILNCMKLFES